MKIQMIAKSVGTLVAALWVGSASAAALVPALPESSMFAALALGGTAEPNERIAIRPDLRRQLVNYRTQAAAGPIVIDTAQTFLYSVVGDGTATRYGSGGGRDGFAWAGSEVVTRKAEWPDWTPPQEMIARQPYLPRWMAGGEGNPLGARAIYLGSTIYRIHGTNMPATIGRRVSSGCIRMLNADISDLYSRVGLGTHVVVLPNHTPVAAIATSVTTAR